MHELSIAQALVEQVEAARQANGGGRVVSVDVRIGQWQHVVPEVLTSYFDYLTQGTPLEAARPAHRPGISDGQVRRVRSRVRGGGHLPDLPIVRIAHLRAGHGQGAPSGRYGTG